MQSHLLTNDFDVSVDQDGYVTSIEVSSGDGVSKDIGPKQVATTIEERKKKNTIITPLTGL